MKYRVLSFVCFLGSACADSGPSEPIVDLPVNLSETATDSTSLPPGYQSNAVRYREPAYQHAVGRSGTASLAVRALLGADGTTDVEVTTGTFDTDDVAPGNIMKYQVKLLDQAMDVEATTNYREVEYGGTAHQQFADRVRHSWVQIQGNLEDIDPDRVDVITATERVNLRPDLSVASLEVADVIFAGVPTDLDAVVRELNGDLGARANCVLYVDGTEADRADDIWVAEGDAVLCGFTYTFASAGEYDVTVRVESVRPGDWDATNDARSTSVTVVDPTLHGNASADVSTTHTIVSTGPGTYDETWADRQVSSLHASAPLTFTFPLTLAEVTQRTGATTVHAYSGTDLAPPTGSNCVVESSTGVTIQFCNAGGFGVVSATRNAGLTTYHSRQRFCHVHFFFCHYHYFDTWTRDVPSGDTWVDWGSTYEFQVRIVHGGIEQVIDETFNLESYSQSLPNGSRTGRKGSVTF